MNFDDYKPTAKYPQKEYIIYCYKNGEVFQTFTSDADFRAWKKDMNFRLTQQPIHERVCTNEEEYNRLLKLYQEDERRVDDQFRIDLFEEFGVLDNPKRYALYSKAYEHGHSYGYSDIYNAFADMVELIL